MSKEARWFIIVVTRETLATEVKEEATSINVASSL
jgi:hypothetical protein